MLVFTTNKKHLQRHFEKDQVLFGYHLGDLDDFYFPDCQWAADYRQRARIEEVIMVYRGLTTPTVLALGLTGKFDELLSEAMELLPNEFNCHFLESYRDILKQRYHEKPLGTFFKMKLTDPGKCCNLLPGGDDSIVRLDLSHSKELMELFRLAYPENYFNNRMLETGKYFGIFKDDRLIAAAGVHVNSDEYKIAVLGNIATIEDCPGKGYATRVTATLVKELVDEKKLVALNVKSDNMAALKCYSNLGFEKSHTFEESFFSLA